MKLNIEIKTKEQRDELLNQLKEMEFKKELPKSWEELKSDFGHISGYGIWSNAKIKPQFKYKDTFATEKQAKSALAKAQLSQLMKVYNDGWVADWECINQNKYSAIRKGNKIEDTIVTTEFYEFITLKDNETYNLFRKNFKPLIRTYFELD